MASHYRRGGGLRLIGLGLERGRNQQHHHSTRCNPLRRPRDKQPELLMSRRDVLAMLVAILAGIALYFVIPRVTPPGCSLERSIVDRLFGNCTEGGQ
jgi:hypothetical protein